MHPGARQTEHIHARRALSWRRLRVAKMAASFYSLYSRTKPGEVQGCTENLELVRSRRE